MKYKTTIGDFDDWEMIVEIDETNPKSSQVIKDMVEFWMGWESLLDDHDGDYNKAFCAQLAKKIVVWSERRTLDGIIYQLKDEEDWAALDGSNGISILSVDQWQFPEPEVKELSF